VDIPTDDELAALALAAEPEPEISADAVPFGAAADIGRGLLPEWYMPAPRGLDRRPSRRIAVTGIIVALVLVNGAGLCVTYGLPEVAW
jgi:hypothetical protein